MFTDGRTQQATQLSGKDMRVVEKVGEGQLPSSTDADCNVRGALKTGQIGPDAASKIFKLITVTWLLGVVVGLVNFAAAVIVVVVVVVVFSWFLFMFGSFNSEAIQDGMQFSAHNLLEIIDFIPVVGNSLEAWR